MNFSSLQGFDFYDQRKKHLNGRGIGGGRIELIAPNKIHWTLNEREGLWPWIEGERIEGEDLPTIEEAIQGFSVPTDVIMIKEELNVYENFITYIVYAISCIHFRPNRYYCLSRKNNYQ